MGSDSFKGNTYYDMLGVPRSASADEIKAAFRRIAKSHHPDSKEVDAILDIGQGDLTKTRAFKMITFAYHTLTDESLRREYDKLLPPKLEDWSDSTPESKGEEFGNDYDSKNLTTYKNLAGKFGVINKQPAEDEVEDIQSKESSVLSSIVSFVRKVVR